MRCNGSNWAVYSPGSWDGFRNDLWASWAGVIMRLEHHLVDGYVRYISPHIIIIIKQHLLVLRPGGICILNPLYRGCTVSFLYWSNLQRDGIVILECWTTAVPCERISPTSWSKTERIYIQVGREIGLNLAQIWNSAIVKCFSTTICRVR